MFASAVAFDQNLRGWNVVNGMSFGKMFKKSGMNFDGEACGYFELNRC